MTDTDDTSPDMMKQQPILNFMIIPVAIVEDIAKLQIEHSTNMETMLVVETYYLLCCKKIRLLE